MSQEQEQPIQYTVNGETQTTTSLKLTVGTILSNAGFTPVADYDLERDEGHKVFNNPDEIIPIHKGEKFTALFKGTTPTS